MRHIALLVGAGFVSEAVYLAVTVRLPWWRHGGMLQSWSQLLGRHWATFGICLVGIGVLFAAYLWGWRLVRQGLGSRGVVWAFACLFAVTLFWLMPITSDVFTYVIQAHLMTDLRANPYLVAALEVPGDRLLLAYPSHYAAQPSVYGPAWLLVSAPATLGRYDVAQGLIYLKGLAVASFLVCAWIVERILGQIRPAAALEGLYLFAWNPLVLLMAAGDGHNDIVMMAAVLLAFWLALCERWVLAFGLVTLSVWIKYVSAVFLPLVVIHAWQRLDVARERSPWPVLMPAMLMTVAISALVYMPFWSPGLAPDIAKRFLQPANWRAGASGLSMWGLGAGLVLFALAYGALAWQLAGADGSYQRLVDTGLLVSLLAFVLGAARSQPWHLIWPAALASLSTRRWVWPVVVGLAAILLVVQLWVDWGAPGANALL